MLKNGRSWLAVYQNLTERSRIHIISGELSIWNTSVSIDGDIEIMMTLKCWIRNMENKWIYTEEHVFRDVESKEGSTNGKIEKYTPLTYPPNGIHLMHALSTCMISFFHIIFYFMNVLVLKVKQTRMVNYIRVILDAKNKNSFV